MVFRTASILAKRSTRIFTTCRRKSLLKCRQPPDRSRKRSMRSRPIINSFSKDMFSHRTWWKPTSTTSDRARSTKFACARIHMSSFSIMTSDTDSRLHEQPRGRISMFVRRTFSLVSVSAASILFGLVTFEQSAAQDVRRICSEKYQSAKKAGTLNDETWPQFYGRCTTEAKANAAVADATAAPPLDTRHI